MAISNRRWWRNWGVGGSYWKILPVFLNSDLLLLKKKKKITSCLRGLIWDFFSFIHPRYLVLSHFYCLEWIHFKSNLKIFLEIGNNLEYYYLISGQAIFCEYSKAPQTLSKPPFSTAPLLRNDNQGKKQIGNFWETFELGIGEEEKKFFCNSECLIIFRN